MSGPPGPRDGRSRPVARRRTSGPLGATSDRSPPPPMHTRQEEEAAQRAGGGGKARAKGKGGRAGGKGGRAKAKGGGESGWSPSDFDAEPGALPSFFLSFWGWHPRAWGRAAIESLGRRRRRRWTHVGLDLMPPPLLCPLHCPRRAHQRGRQASQRGPTGAGGGDTAGARAGARVRAKVHGCGRSGRARGVNTVPPPKSK